MEFYDVVKTAGTCRYYKEDPIPDDVLERVMDAARWAPQGGNRQPNRYILVRNPETRKKLRDLYYPIWAEYLAAAGMGEIKIRSDKGVPKILVDADIFADNFHKPPVIVVVCAKMEDIHPTDLELERDPIVYGCSVYPAVENLLLGARNEGLGGAVTTLLCAVEPQVKADAQHSRRLRHLLPHHARLPGTAVPPKAGAHVSQRRRFQRVVRQSHVFVTDSSRTLRVSWKTLRVYSSCFRYTPRHDNRKFKQLYPSGSQSTGHSPLYKQSQSRQTCLTSC